MRQLAAATSGSPTRASSSSRSTAAARRAAAATGSGPIYQEVRLACRSTTRSPACRRWREATRAWTWTRVGIDGWSFGGYMAALAVLQRPDVFKAAVAGAR